jgi:uncharacterized membrane protein YfcA
MADMIMVISIVTSAYFIRGITGFGSGLIAVPLMALSLPLTYVIPLIVALDFTASSVMGGVNRKQTQWPEVKLLLPAGLIGGGIGIYALLKLPPTPILIALGGFTMFFGFRNVLGLQPVGQIPRLWAIPAGLAGGATGAVFGIGAPPYLMYLSRRLSDKSEIRATFSWISVVDASARLVWFTIAGLLFTPKLMTTYAICLIPMAFGLYTGNKVHLDMTSDAMLKAVGMLLVLSGAMLFLKAVA